VRNKILIELASKSKFKGRCIRLADELADDLYQDMFLEVCKIEESKLIELYNKGKLDHFVMRMIRNIYLSYNSTELIQHEAVAFHEQGDYDDYSDNLIENYLKMLNSGHLLNITQANRDDFAILFLDEYLEEGSVRKFAQKLNTSYGSCYRLFKLIKESINEYTDNRI